ncbi:MAG TPA: 6-phosphogluconolactonase [Candidatus Competibacteraceae bacterium]|nr:6-phosphogluconolactonase [Candidatus Competibacteraceae bacterium]
MPDIHCFDTPAALEQALAEQIAAALGAGVASRGAAALVVSGGRTPIALFQRLAARADVPWAQVHITLADERWLSPQHADSNERLVREHLLAGPAAAARFTGLWTGAPSPEAGQAEAEARLSSLPRPFDVVLLGMGDDGHTASLFPSAPELDAGLTTERLCLALHPSSVPQPRLSLSLKALLDSRQVLLHLVGPTKWRVLQEALRPGPVQQLPVRAVLQANHPSCHVYWSS